MPAELRTQLADAAAEAGRTLTAEIVQRLEWSLRPGGIDETERAEFVRGVIGGVIEAILLEDDPLAAIKRFRGRATDTALSKEVGEFIHSILRERKQLDLKKLGNVTESSPPEDPREWHHLNDELVAAPKPRIRERTRPTRKPTK